MIRRGRCTHYSSYSLRQGNHHGGTQAATWNKPGQSCRGRKSCILVGTVRRTSPKPKVLLSAPLLVSHCAGWPPSKAEAARVHCGLLCPPLAVILAGRIRDDQGAGESSSRDWGNLFGIRKVPRPTPGCLGPSPEPPRVSQRPASSSLFSSSSSSFSSSSPASFPPGLRTPSEAKFPCFRRRRGGPCCAPGELLVPGGAEMNRHFRAPASPPPLLRAVPSVSGPSRGSACCSSPEHEEEAPEPGGATRSVPLPPPSCCQRSEMLFCRRRPR